MKRIAQRKWGKTKNYTQQIEIMANTVRTPLAIFVNDTYLDADTELTETVSPLAVPVTVTFVPANLSNSLSCPLSV